MRPVSKQNQNKHKINKPKTILKKKRTWRMKRNNV
jgi:hypothetical protein